MVVVVVVDVASIVVVVVGGIATSFAICVGPRSGARPRFFLAASRLAGLWDSAFHSRPVS